MAIVLMLLPERTLIPKVHANPAKVHANPEST